VATLNERKIASISVKHDIMDVAKIRGIVENAKHILEVTLTSSSRLFLAFEKREVNIVGLLRYCN